ncbi:MAG: hypothetical protein IJL32_16235 [Oscillospiraceae bacterium]|nr:hypothetical protein [Oscillospiraceae bacterium]
MTPLDIMEALRDVPEDLIDIDYEHLSVSCTAEQETLRTETDMPENGKRMRGSIVLSYLMTACCAAACIGGIAVLICMTKLSGRYSVQPQDPAPLQPAVTVTATAAFPNTATTASALYTDLLIRNTAQPALTAESLTYTEQTSVPVSTANPVIQTTAPPVTTASETVTATHTTASVTKQTPDLL